MTIDDLVTSVEGIVGITLSRTYDLTAPRGVAGRDSDHTMIKRQVAARRVVRWDPV